MYYRHYSRRSPRNAPRRWISAKFESTCPETGKTIRRGDQCLYDPNTRSAYHESSQTATDQRGADFASAYNMADANW